MTAGEVVSVLGVPYRIVRLLGHGKGGYSYLAEGGGRQVVLKQIHHEPCSYYTFGDKIAAEERDYALLCAAGIRVPKLIALDREAERIVKEYIEGPTAAELIEADALPDAAVTGVQRMARLAEAAGLAAYYSKARESANVPVDYTLVKYVSKPSGAKPGMVIYTHQKTIYADPTPETSKNVN